jgi:hypothetical protein
MVEEPEVVSDCSTLPGAPSGWWWLLPIGLVARRRLRG